MSTSVYLVTPAASPAINLAPVRDSRNEDELLGVVDRVHDPVVAYADPEVVAPGKLDGAVRAGVGGEAVDRILDPLAQAPPKSGEGSHGLRLEPNLVHERLWAALADFAPRPRHGGVALVTSLERGEAVLEVVEPVHELGVALRIEHDGCESPTLGDIERILGLAKGVELLPEPGTQVVCGDDPGHAVLFSTGNRTFSGAAQRSAAMSSPSTPTPISPQPIYPI